MKAAAVIFLFLITACKPKPGLEKFNGLRGTWQTNNSETDLYEHWNDAGNNEMFGKSYVMNGPDTLVQQSVILKKQGEDFYYLSTVQGQNNNQAVAFKLIISNDSFCTFENRQQSFPQRISYRFIGKDSLIERMEGMFERESRFVQYYYHRIR